ncbi:MAG: tetratricopeptide repeat protein, partial [Thermoplasmata archaeon]
MVRQEGDIQETTGVEMAGETEVISTISYEGEFPCVLVFPDKKHVQNYTFAPILDIIKQTLIDTGFKIRLLSDESRDVKRYIDEFVKIAKECVYGVVILDGFRPNVLLELGILLGLNKPITLIMSRDAKISVKTLYQNFSEANLTERQFKKLSNPKIRFGSGTHLSDFSTHLTIFDPSANSNEANHVSKRLKESIDRTRSLILNEYEKVNSKSIAETMPDYLQEYQKTLFNILRYYTGSAEFSATDIEKSWNEIKDIEKKSGNKLPSDIRTIVASLYSTLSEKAPWRNVEEIMENFSKALEVYYEALEYEPDRNQKADIQRKIGDIYWKLAQYRDIKENCKKAIKAYEEALNVYTLERFPMDYAMTQN